MKYKKNKMILLSIIILLVMFVPLYFEIVSHDILHPYIINVSNDSSERYNKIGLKIILKIYKNGHIVYKDNDPPVIGLFNIIAENLGGNDYTFTDSGASNTIIYINYPSQWLSSGYDTSIGLVTSDLGYSKSIGWGSISSSLVRSSKISYQDIHTYSTNGDLVLIITKSITMTNSANVYAVTYISAVDYQYYSSYFSRIVVLYDYLSSPISVSSGDVVTVVYEIHLPVSGQYSG